MVLSLLADIAITKGLKEALPFITAAVEAEPTASARSIISGLREAGLSFSDAPAFNIISQLKANLDIRKQFNLNDFTSLPSVDSLERAVSPLSKNYSFLVQIRGFNAFTGSREQRHVTVVSDTLLTPEQIIESALNVPKQSPGSQILGNSTISIVSGRVSPFAL